LRTSPLPSAEINRDGVVYVVWQDRRFEPAGNANDIVLSTSADGTTWSPVSRIPIDPIGSNVDHFIPGLAVSRASGGAQTALGLTYYFQQPAGCVGSTCTIQVGFVSSLDDGQTWSSPLKLSDPMQLGWLAPTNQGAMVGDYIPRRSSPGSIASSAPSPLDSRRAARHSMSRRLRVFRTCVAAVSRPGRPRCCSTALTGPQYRLRSDRRTRGADGTMTTFSA
jgi:hypothetical protein